MSNLILASQSPRRKELLSSLGVEFKTISADIDESVRDGEAADDYVNRLALEKAKAGLGMLTSADATWVLGSDTAVVMGEVILGKPTSKQDFMSMMRRLSGRTHSVLTSIALVSSEVALVELVETKVSFIALTEAQIESYWRSGEPQDKAGGYGIQGLASVFIERIEGSYSAVVGLPLHETAKILSKANLPIWQGELLL